jgi:prepilin-type N-terminal cleavage/methylation domain-containing protein
MRKASAYPLTYNVWSGLFISRIKYFHPKTMKSVPSSVRRGFTLIELLVVIAIIGILSAVVLASLNTARNKGADAAAKSSLNNARAQAELYYDGQTPNSYDAVCTTSGTGISTLVTGAASPVGATYTTGDNIAATASVAACHDAAGTWVAAVPLKAPSTQSYYCVDSTGAAKVTTTALTTSATACP